MAAPIAFGNALGDSLWPNRDWVPAAKMFHSNLYRVRQVTSPSSVEYREGFYQVNRGLALWIDDVEFELLIRAASHTTDNLGFIELLSRAMESCGN
jgi:two-component SAPR family response regulator